MSSQNEPATKKDLADLAADLTADLTSKLASKDDLAKLGSKDDLAKLASKDELTARVAKLASKDELAVAVAKLASKDDLAAMEKRLVLAIRYAATVMIEQISAKIAAIVETYGCPLPQVRADLDAHRTDFSLHTRPAPSAPKRTSRRKPLRPR